MRIHFISSCFFFISPQFFLFLPVFLFDKYFQVGFQGHLMQRGATHWDCQGMTHSGRAGINLDRFSNPFYEVSWRFWLELTKHVADGKADTNFTLAMVIFHQTQVPSIPCPCIWFRRLNSPFSCWSSAQRAWSSLDLWPRLVLLVNFSTGNSSTRWTSSKSKCKKACLGLPVC